MTEKIHWKRSFWTITAGQTVSLIGSSAVQFAMIWWLSSETGSALVMALAGLVAFLPQLVLGPFAGVWIDRWKRKRVVMLADLFQGLVALGVSLWFLRAGAPPYWAVCAALGLRAVGNVFHTPAIQALMPLLAPREALVRVNGVTQFLQSGAFMLGPVLGAALFALLPMWALLLTDLLGALIACLTMAVVQIPELPAAARQRQRFWQELRMGVAVFREDKRLLCVLIGALGSMAFYMPLSSYYPLMSSSYFRVSAGYASLVEVLYAAGMMLAAGVLGAWGKLKNPLRTATLGAMLLGVTSLIGGLLPPSRWGFWVFAAACGLMGAGGNLYSVPVVAYMQKTIAPEKLGRVFSLMGSVMSAAMPLGLLISGPVAERGGVGLWFLITGIAVCVICVAVLAILPHLPEKKERLDAEA